MKVLDTNVLIEYLKGVAEVVKMIERLRDAREEFAISVITEIELLAHPKRTADDFIKINEFLRPMIIVPVDSALGRVAAEIRRNHKRKIADSIVVATAHMLGAQLLTRDQGLRDIPDVLII